MDRKIALFIDFENIARGVRQFHPEERVDLRSILEELENNGRILVKRAYADWGYYKDYRSDLLQQGIEPVQIFAAARDREGWKNGADIRIAIDAMETAYRSPDITHFVLVSGDSDFLSLVNRLRENGKLVWGLGLRASSSQYLMKSCDQFTLYEDIVDIFPEDDGSGTQSPPRRDSRWLLLTTVRRMSDRQGLPGMPPPGTPLKATAVRAAMRRIDPSWDEHFEGFSSFVEFLQAHSDAILCARPGEGMEYFVAERGTVAEMNLLRMAEFVHGNGHGAGNGSGENSAAAISSAVASAASEMPRNGSGSEKLHRDAMIAAIRRILRQVGSTSGDGESVQQHPVRGTLLKAQLRDALPGFDESAYGFTTFPDFLLSMREYFRIARSDARGDILVAERESPAEAALSHYPSLSLTVNGTWSQAPEQRYLAALRTHKIRHVPMAERYQIIHVLCRIFEEARDNGEQLSLKEAKDRLHEWFEENAPAVPWESVNNVVYHLFWTYCFEFEETEEEQLPLWDRPTRWAGGMSGPEEVIRRCDTGLVRMISESVGTVDPKVAVEVLGDHDASRLPYFEEVCEQVNQRFAPSNR